MLILLRKPEEIVMVGDDIQIHLLSILGNRVKLGIEAPKEIPIHREEVYHLICKEINRANITYKKSTDMRTKL